jgi:hypothetical protein
MELVTLLLGIALKYGPDAYLTARKLLAMKTAPTEADWAELDAILSKTGESYFERSVPSPLGATLIP